MSDIKHPVALHYPKKWFYDFAEEISKILNYSPNDSIGDLITKLGGKITERDLLALANTNDGSIYIKSADDFEITIPKYVSNQRNRFTVAHELGHYFLHYIFQDIKGEFKAYRFAQSEDISEWEANWFAASFLMPSKEFKKIHKKYKGDINDVSRHFNVSKLAAQYHAQYLKIA